MSKNCSFCSLWKDHPENAPVSWQLLFAVTSAACLFAAAVAWVEMFAATTYVRTPTGAPDDVYGGLLRRREEGRERCGALRSVGLYSLQSTVYSLYFCRHLPTRSHVVSKLTAVTLTMRRSLGDDDRRLSPESLYQELDVTSTSILL